MIKKSLILAILFSSFLVKAQSNLDSLYAVWQDESRLDSLRVIAFSNFIWNGFLFSKPDTAFILAKELTNFGKKKDNHKVEATGLNLQGISKAVTGDNAQALIYYNQSLIISEEMEDKAGIARTSLNIGNIYNSQGNFSKAMLFFQRSLKLQKKLGDKKGASSTLNNIGTIYESQGSYSKALTYYEKSLKINEEINNKKGIAAGWNNIGLIYKYQGNISKSLECFQRALRFNKEAKSKRGVSTALNNLGSTNNSIGNYVKALEYYQQSLNIREEIGDKQGIGSCLNNIGDNYALQGNTERALEYYDLSLKIRKELNNRPGIIASLTSIGKVYRTQGNYPKALEYCKQGLGLADSLGFYPDQRGACLCLYNTYKDIGNTSEALVYLEKANVINDSLNEEEISKKLQEMEFSKQVFSDSIKQAEKDRMLIMAHKEEVHKKNQTRNMFALVGFIMLLLSIGIYSRLRYVRKSKIILQQEKDRSEGLLLNILPKDIAKELKEKGKADARHFDNVSIIFTDFKGFTAVSEELSAQDLVHEINMCFEFFDGLMDKYNIEKIKTIGDAYMAAGGLTNANTNSVKNTILTALEMQNFINNRKIEMDRKGLPAFEMRAGIHTGSVVAGIVGVKKFQYDIWGDTVNTASRMESSGAVSKVNISQSTYEIVKNEAEFSFESRGKIEAKGKGLIEMYFVQLKS